MGGLLRLVQAPPRPLLVAPNVTADPSTASVSTSYYSMLLHYEELTRCQSRGCGWSARRRSVTHVDDRTAQPAQRFELFNDDVVQAVTFVYRIY